MSIAVPNTKAAVLPDNNTTSSAVTITATTAGRTLILLSGSGNANANPITSVSLGAAAFTKKINAGTLPTGGRVDIWTLANIAGGATTVTVVRTSTYQGIKCVNILEASGLATAPVFDPAANSATGTTSSMNSGTLTPASAANGVLLVSVVNVAGANITAGPTNSWTVLGSTGFDTSVRMAYKIVTAADSVGWTQDTSYRNWMIASLGIDAAVAASGQNPAPPFPGIPLPLLVG